MDADHRQRKKQTIQDADFWSPCPNNKKGKVIFFMSRTAKRTKIEEAKAMDRSQSIRVEMLRQGLSRGAIAYHLGVDQSTLWRRLQRGLTGDEYLAIIKAMGQARIQADKTAYIPAECNAVPAEVVSAWRQACREVAEDHHQDESAAYSRIVTRAFNILQDRGR